MSTEQQVKQPSTLFSSEALRAIFGPDSRSNTGKELGKTSSEAWRRVPLM